MKIKRKGGFRGFLNYSILLLIFLGILSMIVDSYLSNLIKPKFLIGEFSFAQETLISRSIDIKYPSYFQLQFYYPKSEFKDKTDWQSLLGGNPFINGNILNPGAKTEITVSSSVTGDKSPIFQTEVNGSFLCGSEYICRRSDSFFLGEGVHNLEFTINNLIEKNYLWEYALVVTRNRKIDSKVSNLFKVRNFNQGMMWYEISLFLLAVLLRGCLVIITIVTKACR